MTQKEGYRKMTNRQISRHQTNWLWVRIMWENIGFKINSNAFYRILESKKKDFEFIEDKSWQDIMMKCFHFTAKKEKYISLLRFPAFFLLCFVFFPRQFVILLKLCTEFPQCFTTLHIHNTHLLHDYTYLYISHFTFATLITLLQCPEMNLKVWNHIL